MIIRSRRAVRWLVPLVAATAVGCGAPADSDGTDGVADGVASGGVLEALHADSTYSVEVAPGVWYHFVRVGDGPFAIHLAEVDLSHCGLDFDVAAARAGGGERPGGPDRAEATQERVSDLAARHGRTTLVAVNGDFFTPEGRPLGPEVVRGEVYHDRSRPAFAWRVGGRARIGTMGVQDGRVTDVGWPIGRDQPEVDVVGGFPKLLDRGARPGDLGVRDNPSFAASRHPRTAIGLDPDHDRLWLAVVDGRQGEYSTGMSLPELATLLETLGATEALNLDGGGSSVMIVRGRAVSRPSDERGERPVANALLLVEDRALCP